MAVKVKTAIVYLFIAVGCLAVAEGSFFEDEDFGLSSLRDAHRQISDLLAAESRVTPNKPREDLEAPDSGEKVVDADASIDDSLEKKAAKDDSDESVPKKPESEDDDDDDDDSEEDALDGFGGIGNLHSLFNFLRQPASKPWWQGPNVCVDRNVTEEKVEDSKSASSDGLLVLGIGMGQFSSCKHDPSKYTCTTYTTARGKTTRVSVVYHCCHGSRRSRNGCEKVETKSVSETAKEIACDQFEKACENEGISSSLSGNKTIFMPLDSAFNTFKMDEPSGNSILTNEVIAESGEKTVSKREILLNHIVPGVYELSDLENEMLLKTEDGKTLRVNGYPGGVVTVNCAPLNISDKLTNDGVIHSVERVLPPVTKSLAELLNEKRFTKFRNLLEENNLLEPLKGEKIATVFALTDEQVDQLEPKHAKCMRSILRHHILPHTVCTSAVRSSRISSIDLDANWVHMYRDSDDSTVVLDEHSKIVEGDKMATNGVLHVVDTFMVPSSARSATELLQQTNHTRFLNLLEKAGLKKEVDKSSEITLFVPLESRMDDLEILEGDELREHLLFHIGDGKFDSSFLNSAVALPTKDGEEKIRVTAKSNVLSALIGQKLSMSVQCARLTRVDGQICNGVAHEVEKPLTPANATIMEMIENDERFALFKDALKDTKLEEQLKSGELGAVTLLIPTEDGFKELRASTLENIAKDKKAADNFLRAHVLSTPLCCSDIVPSSWPFMSTVKTLSGASVPIFNNQKSGFMVGDAPIDQCNFVAKDGIIHRINGVLFDDRRKSSNPFADEEIVMHRPHSDIILGL